MNVPAKVFMFSTVFTSLVDARFLLMPAVHNCLLTKSPRLKGRAGADAAGRAPRLYSQSGTRKHVGNESRTGFFSYLVV